MPTETRIVRPGPHERAIETADGEVLEVPAGWVLLPPGDAGLTRRVKAAGPTWTVKEKVGRRMFSRGVWAPAAHVETARAALAEERASPAHQKRLDAARARREKKQGEYVESFREAVIAFLAFDARYAALASRVADAVTAHATPVGSGTVARTERIPIDERARAAVIAWMRHQTTDYDRMSIARRRGERREVRRELAQRSMRLLARYRSGDPVHPDECPLERALR